MVPVPPLSPAKPQLVGIVAGDGPADGERFGGRLGRVSRRDRLPPVKRPGRPTKRIVASGVKRSAKATQSPDRTLWLNAATCLAARGLIVPPLIAAPALPAR